jgi:uncharacterized protein
VIRWLWFSLGWFFVALGFIGAVLPVLPSTVFFIAAAACFARSSPRFEAWVLNLPGVGHLVREYRAGMGMPRRLKWTIITIIAVSVLVSAWRVPLLWVKLLSLALGAAGIWYITTQVPTRERVLQTRVETP